MIKNDHPIISIQYTVISIFTKESKYARFYQVYQNYTDVLPHLFFNFKASAISNGDNYGIVSMMDSSNNSAVFLWQIPLREVM